MNQGNNFSDLLAPREASEDVSPYDTVVREVCSLLKLDDVEAVAMGNPFVLSNVRVSIEQGDSSAITVYTEMGYPPKDGEATVLRTLLQRNFAVTRTRGPSFCISTSTGKVLCVAHFLVTALTADELLDAIQAFVDQAAAWRQDYFLWEPEAG